MTCVLACVVLLAVGVTTATAQEIIPWQDAGRYVGQERVVEGTVLAVRREGNVIRLAFDPDPARFTIALIVSYFSGIPPDPERAYTGRTIRARGRIRHFHGVPEMVVRDPNRLVIVAAGTSTSAGYDFDLRDRVEHLERRLEQVEQRLGPPQPPPTP